MWLSPLRQWRSWVVGMALLVGPVLVYVGLGMLWLWERGWVVCTVAAVLWVIAGVAFSVLASRWTKTSRSLMPPLDWNSPQTFSPLDRDAWKIVQDEAEQGETLTFDVLLGCRCLHRHRPPANETPRRALSSARRPTRSTTSRWSSS